MSDFDSIGNLAIGLLAMLSIGTWCLIASRWSLGLPAIQQRPHQQNVWPPYAGFRAFVAAFAVPFLFLLARKIDAGSIGLSENGLLLTLLCITSIAQILVAAGMLTFETRQPWLQMIGFGPFHGIADLAVGVQGFLASLVPVFGVNLLIEKLGWHLPGTKHPLLEMMSKDSSPMLVAGIIVSAAILAPLVEELMYRVALQTELERYLSDDAAMVVTACLFAAVHSLGGRPDALPLLPLALILGYVYRRTRSYPAVVLLHALFNSFNLAMTFLVKPPAQ